jgi:acetylserotonin N-methyltransferase
MHAAVFDLPAVVFIAHEFTGARVELIAGDFFKDELPPADLYAVSRILHDWSEDKIRRLLAKIYAALPPGGALLIAETLLDETGTGPVDSLMQSLNMLVCAEGKERSLPEYAALLQGAGFSQVHGKRTGAPLDAILALKGEVN